MSAETKPDREKLAGFIAGSPYGRLLGIELEEAGEGHVRLRLPYRDDLTTIGDLVHGGALAGLVDVAATAAGWMTLEDPSGARGTTVGLSLSYLRGLRGADAVAEARVVRAGRQIVVLAVDVSEAGGEPCATALVTYKLDRPG